MAKKLKWGTIEYLETLIDEYFDTEPTPSIAGLRVHLGMSDDCWKHYINDRWKVKRKTPEEIEEITEAEELKIEEQAFEQLMEITDSSIVSESDDLGDYHIKERLSTTLKKAKDRIEVAINKQILSAKNPAGSIFYAKAALGYREIAPETDGDQRSKLPTTINIMVMPQPAKPREMQVVEVINKLNP